MREHMIVFVYKGGAVEIMSYYLMPINNSSLFLSNKNRTDYQLTADCW